MGEEGVGGLVAEGFDPRVQCWWCVGGGSRGRCSGRGFRGVGGCDEV